MKSKVSVRGQTVVPKEIREALEIKPGTILHWKLQDGAVVVWPLSEDPIRASVGMLAGKGVKFDDVMNELMEERRKDLAREEKKYRAYLRPR
jgi:AbrB family looped-hinge helix DNA binding protein